MSHEATFRAFGDTQAADPGRTGQTGTSSGRDSERDGMVKRSKKSASKTRMVKALDEVARLQVLERDGGVCVRCRNDQNGAQWAHIISRRHLSTRWEPDNALTLCGGCHFFWHSMPMLAMEWFRKTWPDRHEHILRLFNAGGKVNVKQLYEQLKKESYAKTAAKIEG